MEEYTTMATRARKELVGTVRRVQEAGVAAATAAGQAVAPFVPRLEELPLIRLLPTPRQVVANGFALIEELVESQRDFALGLVDAAGPVTDRILPDEDEGRAGRRSSPKAAAAA